MSACVTTHCHRSVRYSQADQLDHDLAGWRNTVPFEDDELEMCTSRPDFVCEMVSSIYKGSGNKQIEERDTVHKMARLAHQGVPHHWLFYSVRRKVHMQTDTLPCASTLVPGLHRGMLLSISTTQSQTPASPAQGLNDASTQARHRGHCWLSLLLVRLYRANQLVIEPSLPSQAHAEPA